MTTAQDPEELFDLYARDGTALGRAKARRLVHRDGDWHKSLHIWVWGVVNDAPWMVFQRRSAAKDTWPRALDAAVTGHRRAGETIEQTLREADEEIGLTVRPADLVRIGLRRKEHRRAGVLDNELQDIFAKGKPVAISALEPSPEELEALVAVPFAGAERFFEGGDASGARLVVEDGAGRLVEETVRGADLVPALDGYYLRALASLWAVVRGERPEPWEIG